jgi:hypothetical protein
VKEGDIVSGIKGNGDTTLRAVAQPLLVLTGRGHEQAALLNERSLEKVPIDLIEAAVWILSQESALLANRRPPGQAYKRFHKQIATPSGCRSHCGTTALTGSAALSGRFPVAFYANGFSGHNSDLPASGKVLQCKKTTY